MRATCKHSKASGLIVTGASSPFPFTLLGGAEITMYIEQGRVRYSLRPAQATILRLGISASLASERFARKSADVKRRETRSARNGTVLVNWSGRSARLESDEPEHRAP
jgi:hypothetical protein